MRSEPPFDIFQGTREGDTLSVRNLLGRVILKSTIRPFDWGRGSEVNGRRELAATLLFHAGISDPAASEAYATAVLIGLPFHGWTILAFQVHDWYHDYIARGGINGNGNEGRKRP